MKDYKSCFTWIVREIKVVDIVDISFRTLRKKKARTRRMAVMGCTRMVSIDVSIVREKY